MRGKQRLHLIAATVTVALLLAAGPAAAEMLHFDLWDHTPAYNGNHAKTSFDLDPNYNVLGGTLDITAYNADPLYWRVVNFYLGGEQGDGGAIGVYYESPGQVRGSGVMVQLEQKHWVYDLSMVMIADGNEPNGYRYVDFIQIINDILQGSKTDIDVEAWVTSAETGCWVSAFIDLNAEWTGGDDDDDDDDDNGGCLT